MFVLGIIFFFLSGLVFIDIAPLLDKIDHLAIPASLSPVFMLFTCGALFCYLASLRDTVKSIKEVADLHREWLIKQSPKPVNKDDEVILLTEKA